MRAGVLVNPSLLVYAKGGYASGEQRKAFIAPPGQDSYYNHFRTDGYTVGGGAEYSLTDHFYVNAEYRYTKLTIPTTRASVLALVRACASDVVAPCCIGMTCL